ncbi:MAG: division/cell wall cluster transcriptional repressor MraZ [Acidobacteriota bacterium]
MLRGNSLARIDDKGRLKVPSTFRAILEERFGPDLFVTSLSGDFVRLYPLPTWLEIEKKLAKLPSLEPAVGRFLNVVNYFGQMVRMDRQGRVLVQPMLRERAQMHGEVAVLGQQQYLDVWNRLRFESKLKNEPFTEEDQRVLSSLGL